MRRGTGACGARARVRVGGIDRSAASTPAIHSIARVDAADVAPGPASAVAILPPGSDMHRRKKSSANPATPDSTMKLVENPERPD
jgi:hypothetical protein